MIEKQRDQIFLRVRKHYAGIQFLLTYLPTPRSYVYHPGAKHIEVIFDEADFEKRMMKPYHEFLGLECFLYMRLIQENLKDGTWKD